MEQTKTEAEYFELCEDKPEKILTEFERKTKIRWDSLQSKSRENLVRHLKAKYKITGNQSIANFISSLTGEILNKDDYFDRR